MQFPIDVVVGSTTISSHFILNLLAFGLGYRYYTVLRKRSDQIPKDTRLLLAIAAVLGAFLGARLVDMADVGATVISHIGWIPYFFMGGKTIIGAVAGGVVGVELVKWFNKIPRSSGDIFTFPLIYGIMIGRIGCFLTGVSDDTVGLPSTLPWAFDQGDGVPRHPTTVYEIVFLGLLWVVLVQVQKRVPLAEGVLFRLFIVSYFTFRFFVEFLKPSHMLYVHLTAIQLVCLVFALWYSVDIARKQLAYGRAKQ